MTFEVYTNKDGRVVVACIDPPHRTDIEMPNEDFAGKFVRSFAHCTCFGPAMHRDICMSFPTEEF